MKWIIIGAIIGSLFFGIFAVLATLVTYLVFQPLQNFQDQYYEGINIVGLLLLFPLILFMAPYGATSSFFLSPFEIKVLGDNFNLTSAIIGVSFFTLLGAVVGSLMGVVVVFSKYLFSKIPDTRKKAWIRIFILGTVLLWILPIVYLMNLSGSKPTKTSPGQVPVNTDITKTPQVSTEPFKIQVNTTEPTKKESDQTGNTPIYNYTIVSTSQTSSNGSYTVTQQQLADHNKITVKNSGGSVVVEDLVNSNSDAIGYGEKFQCQCGTSFNGWVDNDTFVIKILNGAGETYEYLVEASTGKVIEDSFRRVK